MLPLIVFFLSGFAALLYQVIWQRLLVIFSGADVYSVTVIVAAFMAGLGSGSLAGGYLADRRGPRANLYAFAAAECLVGLFGLASKTLYYDALYTRYSYLASSPALAAAVLFGTLLFPTFLMGLSLPLLARALVAHPHASPRVIGTLYGCNTLGAATGAFIATWVLIPRMGLEPSLFVAGSINLLCAIAAIGLAHTRRVGGPSVALQATPMDSGAPGSHGLPFRAWAVLYALTGFTALGFEIAWFRLLGVMLKSTAFTFGTLLAIYLTGLGAGAAVGARTAARSRHPGAMFLALQYGVALYAAGSVIALVAILGAGHPIELVRFLGSYEPMNVYEVLARIVDSGWFTVASRQSLTELAILFGGVPALLIGPPTLLMGLSFPYLQKASQPDVTRLGRRLGTLLASNIAGGVAGTVVTGWILLPALGSAGTLKTLVATSGVLAWPLARLLLEDRRRRAYAAAAAAALTIGALSAMPSGAALWARLHGTTVGHVIFDEDGAGLSLLKFERTSAAGAVEVYVNGLGQSWLPYGDVHTALGALPAFVHPSPTEIAIIGLGSGDTAFAAAGRTAVQRIASIEILGAQRRTLERFLRLQRYPGLLAVLSDSRVEHHVGDGRAFVAHSGRTFDIIEADALRPSSAYSGNLYSQEYFSLLSRHLTPGGFAVTWAPTARIRDTFLSVFPYVLAFRGDIYIGSNEPIHFDASTVAARAAEARHYYQAAGIDIVALLRPFLEPGPRGFSPGGERRTTNLNTDLFPRDEFALPF